MSPRIELNFEELDGKDGEIINSHMTNVLREKFISCDNVILPSNYKTFAENILNMDVRNDDVWVCSYPKSGTTWTQEMVWCISNNVDLEGAKKLLPDRFPFLERSVWTDHRRVLEKCPDLKLTDFKMNPLYELNSVEFINDLPSPRFIQTHLPFKLLPEKLKDGSTSAKIIYVMRHPGDTCVSYYHMFRLFDGYRGTLEEFATLFLKGKLLCGPYWDHVYGFLLNQGIRNNLLVIKYEEMKKDLRSQVIRVSEFLSKSLNENQICKLLNHLSFENMKNNSAVTYEHDIEYFKRFNLVDDAESFIRKGNVGKWREALSADLVARFEKWISDHYKNDDQLL